MNIRNVCIYILVYICGCIYTYMYMQNVCTHIYKRFLHVCIYIYIAIDKFNIYIYIY